MTSADVDKELMWDLLSNNHRKLAHAWGQELRALSQKRSKQQFHARADECLTATLDWPTEARSRAVKTWLSTYQIPLEASKLTSFDQFHNTTGPWVLAHSKAILAYEQLD